MLEAHDGASGLRLIERQADPIDLLFTDVVMPNMTGRELADKARALQAGLKVLYTSGYTRDAIIHGGRLEPGVDMIAKPFTYHALGQQVRDVLDRGRTGRLTTQGTCWSSGMRSRSMKRIASIVIAHPAMTDALARFSIGTPIRDYSDRCASIMTFATVPGCKFDPASLRSALTD